MTTVTLPRATVEQALEAMEYADACLKKQLTTKTKHEYAQDWLLEAGTALRAALEQPKFTLSCGCPSQYGGVPAYWDRDGSTAFGMICEKHWHEYGARNEA